METNSSGEELLMKTRKPYTITKQREKWTDEEHNKFIEALKLYGRAWQRIEEHIGSKTAVQIRSHAQKFFTKLEKEAATKGVPFGQACDIEIPPPRPKRKPSSPYPRKTGSFEDRTTEEKTLKSPSPLSKAVNIESYAAWKMQGLKDSSDDNSCSEVLNLFQDTPVTTNSSLKKSYSLFMPFEKEMKEKASTSISPTIAIGLNMNEDIMNRANKGNDGDEELEVSKQTDKVSPGDQNCNKNVPIDFMRKTDNKNVETNANSGTSSLHHPSFPGFPRPFSQFPANEDAYRSFFNISSTFSSLIVSTLLQHPAVHAAASVAASYWPSIHIDASTSSSSETRNMSPNPSMASIAAATVAAASAWWATQGLLPIYTPVHTGFAYTQPPITTIPIVDASPAQNSINEEKVDDPLQPEAVRAQSSSSDTSECGRVEIVGVNNKSNCNMDADCARNKKKLDRSSCGSNTPSCSEAETDAVLKNQDGEKDGTENLIVNKAPLLVDTNNRRVRSSSGIMNESWKEVSEEGRMAFQALFRREVLPQSFSPQQANKSMTITCKNNNGSSGMLPVDPTQKAASNEPNDLYYVQAFGVNSGKNPSRKIGFKPYKRCSTEAKESRATGSEENANKRICLERETSI